MYARDNVSGKAFIRRFRSEIGKVVAVANGSGESGSTWSRRKGIGGHR
jgi:hypothetical protein